MNSDECNKYIGKNRDQIEEMTHCPKKTKPYEHADIKLLIYISIAFVGMLAFQIHSENTTLTEFAYGMGIGVWGLLMVLFEFVIAITFLVLLYKICRLLFIFLFR